MGFWSPFESFSGSFLDAIKPFLVVKRIKVSKNVNAKRPKSNSLTILNNLGNTKLITNKTIMVMHP
jgi:hypothetical protein